MTIRLLAPIFNFGFRNVYFGFKSLHNNRLWIYTRKSKSAISNSQSAPKASLRDNQIRHIVRYIFKIGSLIRIII
jgi:hypothetical protein